MFQDFEKKDQVILCDLFGMVKWPFQMVKWPPTRGWKGHIESPGMEDFDEDFMIRLLDFKKIKCYISGGFFKTILWDYTPPQKWPALNVNGLLTGGFPS